MREEIVARKFRLSTVAYVTTTREALAVSDQIVVMTMASSSPARQSHRLVAKSQTVSLSPVLWRSCCFGVAEADGTARWRPGFVR
jgi:hypothetical protein